MRSTLLCLSVLGLLSVRTVAQDASALRAKGLEAGYNLDYDDALGAFRAAAAEDPNDGTAHRLAAATLWMRLLFEQGAITVEDYLGQARTRHDRTPPPPHLAAAFHHHLERAFEIAKGSLQRSPTDVEARFQLGAAEGLRASYIATVEGRVRDSLGPARRAYAEHKRVLEADPSRKDAGLIVGTYQYTIANLSFPLRLLARLSGFGGGRESGVRLVEAAAAHESASQPGAKFMLALMYNRERRHDDALRVLRTLQGRFPRNRLLWLEIGSTSLRAGRPADALTAVDTGLQQLLSDDRPRARGEEARWRQQRAAAAAGVSQSQRRSHIGGSR
jgi:tetratricopeptide (TPR) repeat protein